jgi:transposase
MKMHEELARGPAVVLVIQLLARHVRGRGTLLWDGLTAHRAKPVRDWLHKHPRFQIERLPAYRPELNLVEGLCSWMK